MAAKVLANAGIQLEKVGAAVVSTGRGARVGAGDIGLTPRAKNS